MCARKSVCMEKSFPSCRYSCKHSTQQHRCVYSIVSLLPRVCVLTNYHVTNHLSNPAAFTRNALLVRACLIGIDPCFTKPSSYGVTHCRNCSSTLPTYVCSYHLATLYPPLLLVYRKPLNDTLRFCIPARCPIVSQEGSPWIWTLPRIDTHGCIKNIGNVQSPLHKFKL